MKNQHKCEDIQNKMHSEQENAYTKSLKNQYFEIEIWKMKIDMITIMKNKEKELKNDQITELVGFKFEKLKCSLEFNLLINSIYYLLFSVCIFYIIY